MKSKAAQRVSEPCDMKRERSCMVSDSVHISHNVAYVVCTYWCHIKESCNICCLYICCAHDTIIEG